MHYVMFIGCKTSEDTKWCAAGLIYNMPNPIDEFTTITYYWNCERLSDILRMAVEHGIELTHEGSDDPYLRIYCKDEIHPLLSDVCKYSFPNADIEVLSVSGKKENYLKQCERLEDMAYREAMESMQKEIPEHHEIQSAEREISLKDLEIDGIVVFMHLNKK